MGVIGGVFALVLDFREVMLTSPPELTHCGGGALPGFCVKLVLHTFEEVGGGPTKCYLGQSSLVA